MNAKSTIKTILRAAMTLTELHKKNRPFCVLLLCVFTATTAMAQVNTELTEGDWKYMYDNTNAATLTEYIGTATSVTTPATIAGHTVVSIGERCFYHVRNTLESVVISSGVSTIGKIAFGACSKMTSITIPSSVNTISSLAFSECSGLTSITIPISVTSIEQDAFYSCSGLTSIALPNGLSKIEDRTFQSCSGLTSISIPHGVESIGDQAFAECTNLASVTVPNSVTTIGNSAFQYCI